MLRRGEFSVRIYQVMLFSLSWSGLLFLILLYVDCGQVFALSYVVNLKSDTQLFYTNIEEIQNKVESSFWVEREEGAYSKSWVGWQLKPYPVHVEGGLYYGLIFDGESISVSQIQPGTSFAPSPEIFPIPESSTLFLMGIGLLGVGGLIRWEVAKKLKRSLLMK